MFNRQAFNRGKFNAPVSQSYSLSGTSSMKMGTEPIKVSLHISAKLEVTNLVLNTELDQTTVLLMSGLANMAMTSKAVAIHDISIKSLESSMAMDTTSEPYISGEDVIDLKGIVLRPGDELVINTCDMTVTINGQNAVKFVTDDSSFFELLTGENNIIYSDSNTARNIIFDIIWKDRWI